MEYELLSPAKTVFQKKKKKKKERKKERSSKDNRNFNFMGSRET